MMRRSDFNWLSRSRRPGPRSRSWNAIPRHKQPDNREDWGATNTTMTEKDLRRDLPQLDAASFARFLAAVDGATSVAGDGATAVKAARVIEWAAGPVGPGMELLIQTYVDLFGQGGRATKNQRAYDPTRTGVADDFEARVRALAPPHFDQFEYELCKAFTDLRPFLPGASSPLNARVNALFTLLRGAEGPSEGQAHQIYRQTFRRT